MSTTQRDFSNFTKYLNSLEEDIYAQPPDVAHTEWSQEAIQWISESQQFPAGTEVMDIGCGQGFSRQLFSDAGFGRWHGVTLGEDYQAIKHLPDTHEADMSFLPFGDNYIHLIYARHVLEHSPFPLLTLMEWRRVSDKWLALVVPAPEFWGYRGKNHYSVMGIEQLRWVLQRAGWTPIAEQEFNQNSPSWRKHNPEAEWDMRHPAPVEFRLLCLKSEPVTE